MTDVNKNIEQAGYKTDKKGNVITLDGKKVNSELAELIKSGKIVANFDMDALKKRKARAAATGTADLVGELRKISPAIEYLEVGQSTNIPVPEGFGKGKDPNRAFLMNIVTKFNNITVKGREWAGKQFTSRIDDKTDSVWVTRMEDTDEPRIRATGGRKKSADRLVDAEKALDAKLAEGKEVEQTQDNEDDNLIDDLITDEATVIKH